jgi:hypothetical protein
LDAEVTWKATAGARRRGSYREAARPARYRAADGPQAEAGGALRVEAGPHVGAVPCLPVTSPTAGRRSRDPKDEKNRATWLCTNNGIE